MSTVIQLGALFTGVGTNSSPPLMMRCTGEASANGIHFLQNSVAVKTIDFAVPGGCCGAAVPQCLRRRPPGPTDHRKLPLRDYSGTPTCNSNLLSLTRTGSWFSESVIRPTANNGRRPLLAQSFLLLPRVYKCKTCTPNTVCKLGGETVSRVSCDVLVEPFM